MIVTKMINIVDTARSIWKKEPLQYISVTVTQSHNTWYCEVEGMGIDSEFTDCWAIEKLTQNEVEPAIRIIKRINFGNERVEYLDNGIEFWVRSSLRVEKIQDSIRALRRADFYSELHQESSCVYSCILKDTQKAQMELKQFLNTYSNVECHYEYGIYELYM